MSLFDDILESNKVQSFIEKSPYLQKVYNNLQNKKTLKQETLTKEELDEEKYKFAELVKAETSTMTEEEKSSHIKNILSLDDKFPILEGETNNKYQELEFFTSNQNDLENTVFSKINKTHTTVGKFHLMNLITHPTTDITVLLERKNLITQLADNPQKLEKIRDDINTLKSLEGDVLWFFRSSSEEMKNMYSMVYFNNFWNRWVNKNEFILNIFYYAKLIIIPLYGICAPIFILFVPYVIITKLLKINVSFKAYWSIIKKLYFSGGGISQTMKGFFRMYERMKGGANDNGNNQKKYKTFFSFTALIIKLVKLIIDSNFTKMFYYIFSVGTYIYGIYSTLNFSYAYLKIIRMFQVKLSKLATWIKTTQHLYNELGCLNCTEIKEHFLNKINFKEGVLKLLEEDVFKNSPSYVFSNKGIILKQFYTIKDNPDILKEYISYLGLIDVWSSIATMFVENKNHMSLPEYISYNSKESNNKPQVNVENFYNIMIPTDKTVKNSIQIGSGGSGNDSGSKDSKKDIMVTGPNASGKSTFLKAITESLILGQTICLVPASKMSFTPFHQINTYLNIPDCQGKESLFQAEMTRCYKQIEGFKSLKKNEYVFSIMDEIFVSTNYFEGLSGAYAISKKMASFDNSICLISTHFSKLSEKCENENTYKNFHFSIDYDDNNKIRKSYTLKEGRTKQHIALEMLEEKGFDNDLVKNAKDMYKYLIDETTPSKSSNNKNQSSKKLTKKNRSKVKQKGNKCNKNVKNK